MREWMLWFLSSLPLCLTALTGLCLLISTWLGSEMSKRGESINPPIERWLLSRRGTISFFSVEHVHVVSIQNFGILVAMLLHHRYFEVGALSRNKRKLMWSYQIFCTVRQIQSLTRSSLSHAGSRTVSYALGSTCTVLLTPRTLGIRSRFRKFGTAVRNKRILY